jgi:hypothetical protein
MNMTETYSTPFCIPWLIWIQAAVVLAVLVLAIAALLALRRCPMDEVARFLWALLIALAPVIGPVVFFIVRPGSFDDNTRQRI